MMRRRVRGGSARAVDALFSITRIWPRPGKGTGTEAIIRASYAISLRFGYKETGQIMPWDDFLLRQAWEYILMGKLDNRIAVITGAGSGIGEATAKLFAAEGARVVMSKLISAITTRAPSAANNSPEPAPVITAILFVELFHEISPMPA